MSTTCSAAVLGPAGLLADPHRRAHPGGRAQPPGVLTTDQGSYRVHGDVSVLDGWRGIIKTTIPLAALLDVAADAGFEAAAVRLAVALADRDRAHRDAARYVERHSAGGAVLSPAYRRG